MTSTAFGHVNLDMRLKLRKEFIDDVRSGDWGIDISLLLPLLRLPLHSIIPSISAVSKGFGQEGNVSLLPSFCS